MTTQIMPPLEEKPLILLIDDDEEVRYVMRMVVEREGMNVIEANSGEAGVTALFKKDQNVSLVILDWMMPGMNGMDVLSRMSEMEDPPPVLMLTAKSDESDVETALLAGACDYLFKPAQHKDLVFKINNILSRSRDKARQHAAVRKPVSLKASCALTINAVHEDGMTLECSFPVPKDTVIFVESSSVCLSLDLARDHRFSLKISECAALGTKNRYKIEGKFLALPPAAAQMIRKVNRAAKWQQ